MKVQSLIREKNELIPVEVELTLWPGLPGIQFLGLPDQHLKESALRIKSAIRQAGFEFPKSQQILVNLRPSHLKKTSRGLELAVAVAYLWESGQIPKAVLSSDYFIYGELTLMGEVLEPDDLNEDLQVPYPIVLTGSNLDLLKAPSFFRKQVISSLKDIKSPIEKAAENVSQILKRPRGFENFLFSQRQARLLQILAVGEHSSLLAGPAGSGKSTIAQVLPGLLRKPSEDSFKKLLQVHRQFDQELDWRPVIKPHHTTPTMAMIGGGNVPFAGEISRAHGGVLILDEMLEFNPIVQEALREPFEEGKIRVSRAGKWMEYPAKSLIVGTTNLCPCGDWTPLEKNTSCRFSAKRCQSYSQKLSGPLVDRFEILEFTERLSILDVSFQELSVSIQKAQSFSDKMKGAMDVCNSQKEIEWVENTVAPKLMKTVFPEVWSSRRRRSATLRVARTLADLDQSDLIHSKHIDEALKWTMHNFEKLRRWGN